MALVPVTMLYDTKAVIDATGLLNGQILYTTDQIVNKIYADVLINGTLTRIEIGGTNEIDTVLNQESGHAIANSAVAKLAQTVHTNLLNPTLGTTTVDGVTCTANGDGTYTLNGRTTVGGLFPLATNIDTLELPKTYRLVGCPSGGTGSTFELNAVRIKDGSRTVYASDYGNGATREYESGAKYEIRIRMAANTPFDNVTFKPMLTTDLSATYDDFVAYSGDGELNENVARINRDLSDIWKVIYPVGSIYMSVNSANPATLFGGTWERIKDRFLLASGDTYSAGFTGGEATHTLTEAEMPQHYHTVDSHSHGLNNHTHYINSQTVSTTSNGGHNHFTMRNASSGNQPPFNTVYLQGTRGGENNYILAGGSRDADSGYTSSIGGHEHSVTVGNVYTGGNGGNTTSASPNTNNKGSSSAHNNMPPYLAVYVWKRTA